MSARVDDLVERLDKRAREWGAQVDGWIKQAEDAGQKVGAETERVMRDTIYREAADEIKRLRACAEDATKALPVLITMLKTAGLGKGANVAIAMLDDARAALQASGAAK